MTKISCAMIVRDDAVTLEGCLESIRPHVDELVIVDTGSVDQSPEIARRYADHFEVWLECNDDEGRIADFAAARNRSFELCSHQWVCWFDGDDVVQNGENLRKLAESATDDNAMFLLPYDYAHDAAGNVTCLQRRERLMRPRHKFKWVSPVHEVCILQEPIEGSALAIESDLVRVVHRKELSRKAPDPDRNLRILKDHVAKSGEGDVRALFYLGVEYAVRGDVGSSLRALKRYVELASWADEKCKALLQIAMHYAQLGDHGEAIEWACKALVTRSWPEPYFVLGRCFYALAMAGESPEYNFKRAAFWIGKGMELPTDVLLFGNPMERHEMHAYLNVCLSKFGDLEGAIKSCEAGLAALPDNQDMQFNLKQLRGEQAKRTLRAAIDGARDLGAIDRGQAELMQVAMSGDLRIELESPGVTDRGGASHNDLSPRPPAPGKLRLAIFVGHGVEPWSPQTWAQTGLGGSETMVWELGRRLARLGHEVAVYGHCVPAMEGRYEGVLFLDASRFRNVECDVLITSRRPDAVDDVYGCKAGAVLLWVHDVHCGELLDMKRSYRIDRILCLSEWHKSFFLGCYPLLPPEKVLVTRNGIDLTRFEGTEERNPHRAIYSSSPDRGLLTALECWPRIREQVPDAELHVFYGFGTWETCARAHGDETQLKSIAHLKRLLKTTPGVVFRDRVSQTELAREFMRAGVWAYPTWFSETSCITAMEAQAAGLYIVTSPIAALKETCPDAAFVEGDWRSKEYADAFAGKVVNLMTDYGLATEQPWREHYRKLARRFSLDSLADDWDAMLLKFHADMTEMVVPPFKDVAAE